MTPSPTATTPPAGARTRATALTRSMRSSAPTGSASIPMATVDIGRRTAKASRIKDVLSPATTGTCLWIMGVGRHEPTAILAENKRATYGTYSEHACRMREQGGRLEDDVC